MRLIPENLSLIGTTAVTLAFVLFTSLIAIEIYSGREISRELLALWFFCFAALIGTDPLRFFRRNNM